MKLLFALFFASLLILSGPLSVPAWADQPNQHAGGGPGNSGPGDKNSPVEGPPDGCDHGFPGDEDAGACD